MKKKHAKDPTEKEPTISPMKNEPTINQGKKRSIIIPVLLAVILLGAAGYFGFQIFQLNHNQIIDDYFVRKYLPKYPESVILTPAYLDFFTPEDPGEKERALENRNQYIIRGDFNQNGKPEVAIAGLLSKKPTDLGNYIGFVLVLEKEKWPNTYRQLSFTDFLKEPNSVIKNIFLFTNSTSPGTINVGFVNNSGIMGTLEWNGKEYKFETDAENW